MNFLQIKERMAGALGWTINQLGDDDLERLGSLANEALQKFSDAHSWPFLKDKSVTLTVDAASFGEDLPADFGGISADRTPFYPGNSLIPILPKSVEEMDYRRGLASPTNLSTGYALQFNQTTRRHVFRLFPAPAADTDVTVVYWVQLPDMVDDDDVVPIPLILHPAYLMCAMDYALKIEGRMAESPYTAEFERALQAAINRHGRNDESNSNPLYRVIPRSPSNRDVMVWPWGNVDY